MDRTQDCFNQDVIMTKIVIYKSKNHIVGFEISGHTGYAEEGSDIVCSAISSISQMVVVGVIDILKLDATVKIDDGYLKLMLKKEDYDNESAQTLLKSMRKSLDEILKEYGNYVKLEVKKDVF